MNRTDEQSMMLTACVFRRQKGAPWEHGIMINNDQLIIDMNGIPVRSLFGYELANCDFQILYRPYGRAADKTKRTSIR